MRNPPILTDIGIIWDRAPQAAREQRDGRHTLGHKFSDNVATKTDMPGIRGQALRTGIPRVILKRGNMRNHSHFVGTRGTRRAIPQASVLTGSVQ